MCFMYGLLCYRLFCSSMQVVVFESAVETLSTLFSYLIVIHWIIFVCFFLSFIIIHWHYFRMDFPDYWFSYAFEVSHN